MNKIDIINKLFCFAADEVTVFHGVKNGVMTQLMQKYIPFMSNVQCMAHYTNLIVQMFNNLSLLSKIEFLLVSMYNCFCLDLKRHFKTTKLIKLLSSKGNNFFENIKMCWISMFLSSKHVLSEYKLLIVKMVENDSTINITRTNYELICDVEMFLGITSVMPSSEVV